MIEIWFLAIVFIILLLLPIVAGHVYYSKNKGEVLFIQQDKVRDPRYFGKSFSSMIKKEAQNIDGNLITLSKKEKFINGDREKIDLEEIDKIVISLEKDFIVEKGKKFTKEIYGEKNIFIEENVNLRAVYSDQDIVIGKGSKLIRWADAEGTISVYDDCNLGISVSSANRISVGQNCNFQRMYAPEIYIGQYPGQILDPTKGKDPKIYRLPVQTKKRKNKKYICDEVVNEEGLVDFSILSNENVSITENIIIKGDVRSEKGVRLFDGAVVVGNVFAEGDIILGENSCVLGNVFSQESVHLEKGAVVGKKGSISSLIARETITLEPGTFVFGYISCERRANVGFSLNIDVPEEYTYLKAADKEKMLIFKDLNNYRGVDQQAYRYRQDIEEVVIPQGAKKIQKSMFFKCKELKKIYLPDTIEEIEDFAFADCIKLEEISLKGKTHLRKIGISAFENCKSLEKVEFPRSVDKLEASSFAGCIKLSDLSFAEDSNLRILEDHCFRGCISLRKIRFTRHLDMVSHSAFKDCDNLKDIQFLEEIRL